SQRRLCIDFLPLFAAPGESSSGSACMLPRPNVPGTAGQWGLTCGKLRGCRIAAAVLDRQISVIYRRKLLSSSDQHPELSRVSRWRRGTVGTAVVDQEDCREV